MYIPRALVDREKQERDQDTNHISNRFMKTIFLESIFYSMTVKNLNDDYNQAAK